MKNQAYSLLYFVILLFAFLNLSGQSYTPFTANSIWRARSEGASGPQTYNYYDFQLMLVNQDTIINGLTYKKIMARDHDENLSNGSPIPPYENLTADAPDRYFGGLRDSNKKIYFRYPSNLELLIYDFNLSIGDTVPQYYTFFLGNWNVPIIDTAWINFPDGLRRAQILPADTLVEGIGSLREGLFGHGPWFGQCNLICYKQSDTIFYKASSYNCSLIGNYTGIADLAETNFSLKPNPANDQFTIEFPGHVEGGLSVRIFNSSGQKIFSGNFNQYRLNINTSQFPNGVYLLETGSESFINRNLVIVQH